ncbi:XRE family transcriptional regulator [Streptomyces sp. NPDC001700]
MGHSHRAWLESVRSRYFASGLTLDDLVSRSGYSKTRISELLRGKGYYPGWEITYSVVRSLDIPVLPLRRLWTAAAREARKDTAWIESRIHAVPVQRIQPEKPPVAYEGFTNDMREPYTAYARAFLQTEGRARWTVREVFDILWLGWDKATASDNARRHAWRLLRHRVLLRAHQHDGHPDLRPAAFSTLAQSKIEDLAARIGQIHQQADFFDAIARLPADQRDVTVLRYLCGISEDTIPTVVGLSPAVAHAMDHHARGALERIYHRHENPE